MPKVLRSAHAEDVGGGRVVEPGQPIPDTADPEVVKRLEADGLVQTTKPHRRTKTKPTEED
jgi:hypothetical protein